MTFRCRHCPALLHSLAQYRAHYRALHFVPMQTRGELG